MNAGSDPRVKQVGTWSFLLLAVGLTWLFWIPAVQVSDGAWRWATLPLIVLGGAMPLLAVGVTLRRSVSRGGRQEFWQRVVDGRKIGHVWWGVILLSAPVITALAGVSDLLAGGSGAALGEPAVRAAVQPLTLVPFLLMVLVFGPLPEEIAWRGYALDRLLETRSMLTASVAIWGVWAVWHLPLFLVSGTYQEQLGLGTLAFWLYLAEMLPRSVVMTWVFLNTSRSTLAMILFHFAVNAVGELFELSPRGTVFQGGLWLLLALVVMALWRDEPATSDPERPGAGSGGFGRVSD